MNHLIVPVWLSLATMAFCQGACSPSWSANTFTPNGPNGGVLAMTTFDDGSGPALYVGGTFTAAGGAAVNNVARWNGSTWSALGGGTDNTVSALAVFDDGTGPALYAGGLFLNAGGNPASRIAKWNGSAWSALGAGTNGSVAALAVFGSGPVAALYVAGSFSFAGPLPAANVARWRAGGWSSVGGLPGSAPTSVEALVSFDDGTGPALYAGGQFPAPPFNANNLWKWNGTTWSVVGTGILSSSGAATVWGLAVHDDGSGPALFIGGSFATAGGVATAGIAKWNGSAYSPLGSGLNGPAIALGVFDDGSGAALFASGFFTTAGGAPAVGIARWSGGAWTGLGTGLGGQGWSFAVHDDGSGPALFIGGNFTNAGGQPASNIVKFTTFWQSLGPDGSLVGTVDALALFDDGTGPHLYAGGMFTMGAIVGAGNIAKWSFAGWTPIGLGIDGPVLALAVFDDGGGPQLYAGGLFTTIGGVAATGIARWNGVAWSPVGGGVTGYVRALAVFDDGTGPALYAGGIFTNAGGNPVADYLAKWNGAWSPVGVGVNGPAFAFAVHDEGSGPALFAAGDFTIPGGAPVIRIAKWNGTSWAELGAGVDGACWSLASHSPASGPPVLIAGGDFTHAGGVAASKIAAWNGASWAPLGAGLGDRVLALRSFDDGGGPALYAGGNFATAGGSPAMRLARWDGAAWNAPGDVAGQPTPNLWVRSLLPFDDGSGPALYVGGQFSVMGGTVSLSVARRVPGGPPVIRAPLQPQIIFPGGALTLSVTASGSPPLSFVWIRNGAVIPGATASTYAIASAGPGDAGSYSVLVTNACGSTASNTAPLSIIPGLATYGTATAGCGPPPAIGAISAPQVGNAVFFFGAAHAPPGQSGLCAISGAPLAAPLIVSGIAAWIDPSSPALFFIPAQSDAGGFCLVPAGLPPDPALAGAMGFVQMAWTDPCAGGWLAATNALAVTIVP